MRKRRLFSRCFLLVFLLFFLSPSAIAHGGKTDSNGGHYDSSTGDYHYHHGYPAHAHFDMDDDGILDCPYDYDDQTDHTSRTSTSSGTYTQGKKDGYTEGYEDGYKKGEADGFDEGFDIGQSRITSEYEGKLLTQKREYEEKLKQAEQEYSSTLGNLKFYFAFSIPIIALCFLLFHRTRLKKKRKVWEAEEKKRISKLEQSHRATITQLNAENEKRVNELIAAQERKTKLLVTAHEAIEKKNLAQIKRLERASIFDRITAREDPSIQLPLNVHFKETYTPVKGIISKNYPYGEYTVFMAQSGNKYHYHPQCTPSVKPVHFFDICMTGEPCRKCVPKHMYPQPLPDWYVQIRERLDTEYKKSSIEK